MPDAAGHIRGIAVPELPWLQKFKRDQAVRVVAGEHAGRHGVVIEPAFGAAESSHAKVVVGFGMAAMAYCYPGELRPA